MGQARVINQYASHEAIERTLPEPLQKLLQSNTQHSTGRETEKLQELLYNYQQVFSLSDRDLGTTHMVQYRIETGNVPPIRQQPRRSSPWKHNEIVRQVTDLPQEGKMIQSSSHWSSPVVVKDGFPLRSVDDSQAALSGSRWFSTLDLASSYWQVAMDAN